MSQDAMLLKPRHCIVVTRFAPDQPGFLDFSYRIRALVKHYRVTVLSDFVLNQPELDIDGVKYMVLPGGQGRAGWLRYIWHCGRLIRRLKPHCAVLLHSAAAPVALFTGGVSTALYWNEHPTHFAQVPQSLSPFKHAIRFVSRWLAFHGARKADIVMPIGEAHNDDLLKHGCPPHRLRLIYMGVDAAFSALPMSLSETSNAPLKLIYVGTVNKARGRDIMLEAIKLANRDGQIAHLTLIGASAEEQDYCRDYIEREGIADVVSVQGRIAGAQIPAWLRQADAGLCLWEDRPWWRFNPPTKLFEYLVAGLPVLASDIRTHTQYVADGSNGLIFRYDSESLAQAIRILWQRRAELHKLKRQARASGEQYLWERIEPVFLQTVGEVARP